MQLPSKKWNLEEESDEEDDKKEGNKEGGDDKEEIDPLDAFMMVLFGFESVFDMYLLEQTRISMAITATNIN